MLDDDDDELAAMVAVLADTEAAARELQAAVRELKEVAAEMRLYFLQGPGDDGGGGSRS